MLFKGIKMITAITCLSRKEATFLLYATYYEEKKLGKC
jgi:hypothetical protein